MYTKNNISLLIFFFLSLCYSNVHCEVITYKAPQEIAPSKHYQVKADQKDVYVYESPIASYAIFDFSGSATVTIKARLNVKWVDIRPRSLNIKPVFNDSLITFTLPHPCNISIELNGEPNKFPLFLFTNSIDKAKPDAKNPNVILFEGGKVHKPGLIKLRSNQTIFVEGGAVVEGAILAENAENIKVEGRGVFKGVVIDHLSDYGKIAKFIELRNCKNVEIKDVTLVDGPTWQIVPVNSDNVNITNTRILSDNNSDDGIDVVRSRNVKIDKVFIRVKDDCIVVKSTMDYPDSVNVDGVLVTNSVLWNAAWGNAIEIGFELKSNEVKNIKFKNCDIIHVDKGAALSIHNGDDSKVSEITFEDIRIEDDNHKLIDLAIFYSRYSVDRPKTKEEADAKYMHGAWDGVLKLSPREKKEHSKYRGTIENITFRNISVTDGIFPFSIISGFDENHLIRNIVIDNLRVHGVKINNAAEARLFTEFADRITFK